MTDSNIKTYKLSKTYLGLLVFFTLFTCLIFAFPIWVMSNFLLPFSLQVLILWVPFMSYFLSKEIVLSEESIIFKNIFRKESILWENIVDYTVRGYYGSRHEATLGEIIAYFTNKPQTSGTILEIWSKNKKDNLDYTEQNITNFSNSEEFLGALGQKVQRKGSIQKKTLSLSFYIKTHKAYTAIVALSFFSLLAFGIYSIAQEDKAFAMEYFVILLPASILWFLSVRNFFNRR